MTFRLLRSLLAGLPADGTALWRKHRRATPTKGRKALPPPDDWWTPERDLLASVVDALHILAWQRTKDGQAGHNFPKPIPRPGVAREATRPRMAPRDAVALLEAASGRSVEL